MGKILELQIKQPVSFKKTVILPEEVLAILNIGPRDAIIFGVKDGEVRLFSAFTIPIPTVPVPAKVFIQTESAKLPKGIKVEYQIQKLIMKSA